ncbi:MAG: winged helix-turn-helix domain-containing protein [Rhodospirillales bacterium]
MLCAGAAVTMTARLFDMLLYLVQNPERLVPRDELEHAVWQSRVVADGNLQKTISLLRKALQVHELPRPKPSSSPSPAAGFRFAVPVAFEPYPIGISSAGPFDDLAGPAADPRHPRRWWQGKAALLLGLQVLLLAAIAGAIWRPASPVPPPAPFAPPPHSVAVMAFTNLSGDPRQEYFSDGLSEELINALDRISALQVAARLSSFSFKGKSATIRDIAGNSTSAPCSRAACGATASACASPRNWSTRRPAIRSGRATSTATRATSSRSRGKSRRAVATSLQVTLLGDDAAKLTLGSTTNPHALDAYLRGMMLQRLFTVDSQRQALAAFDEAVALDPNYALAHAQRAATMIRFVEGFGGLGSDLAATQQYRARAMAEAQLAVSLAPRLGAAHAVLAGADEEAWRFSDAEAEYTRARELAPGDAAIEQRYAHFAVAMGHNALAVAAAQRGAQLDPLSPIAYVDLAAVLIWAQRPDDALTSLRHAQQLGFGGPRVTDETALVELQKKHFEKVRQICAGMQNWAQDFYLAIADHALGRQDEAQAALAKLLAQEGDNSAFYHAEIEAQWGDTQAALQWLETAYRLHDDGLIGLKTDWRANPLRGNPRFQDIVRRMNFPP